MALFTPTARRHFHGAAFAVDSAATRLRLVRYGFLMAYPAGVTITSSYRSVAAAWRRLGRRGRATTVVLGNNGYGCHDALVSSCVSVL